MSITMSSSHHTKYKVKIKLVGYTGDHQSDGEFKLDVIDRETGEIVERDSRKSLGAAFRFANKWIEDGGYPL